MIGKIFKAALMIACLAGTAAQAETIKRKGGSAITQKIGPWYIERSNYEDGSRTCWALNPDHGRNNPTFSIMTVEKGEDRYSSIRFDALRDAATGETVTLAIGETRLKLVRQKQSAPRVFTPKDGDEAFDIIRLLLEAEGYGPRNFHVIDKAGKRYRFDARSTSDMLMFLKRNCKLGE